MNERTSLNSFFTDSRDISQVRAVMLLQYDDNQTQERFNSLYSIFHHTPEILIQNCSQLLIDKLNAVSTGIGYYFYFIFQQPEKPFPSLTPFRWTEEPLRVLLGCVMRYGCEWKKISRIMFGDDLCSRKCQKRWHNYIFGQIETIDSNNDEQLYLCCTLIEQCAHGNYATIAQQIIDTLGSHVIFVNAIDQLLETNPCSYFICAHITKEIIYKLPELEKEQLCIEIKNRIQSHISFERYHMLVYFQWCYIMGVFSKEDLKFMSLPPSFFKHPKLETIPFAPGDIQNASSKKRELSKQKNKTKFLTKEIQCSLDTIETSTNDISSEEFSSLPVDNQIVTNPVNIAHASHLRGDLTKIENILIRPLNEKTEAEKELLKQFSSILYLISPQAFRFVHDNIRVFSKSSVENYLSNDKKVLKQDLLNINRVPNLLTTFYSEYKNKETFLPATIAGDAAIINSDDNTIENLYCFQILPLDHTIKPSAIHFERYPKGAAPVTLRKTFENIKEKVDETKLFKILFYATDGEPTTTTWHTELFEKTIKPIIDENFFTIVDEVKKNTPWPISDVLHLLKCARSHILNHLVCVFPKQSTCINIKLMQEALQIGLALTDRSTEGRMKDSYVISLFSWSSFVKLINAERYEAAYYILPFMCMNEAIRSQAFTIEERKRFLCIAFQVFRIHFHEYETFHNNPLFSGSYSNQRIGTLFADITFIRRCINTIIGITYALSLESIQLGLERIGTHCLECFFGYMRICTRNDNSFDRSMHAAIKSLLISDLSRKMGYHLPIRTRINQGGAKLTPENEDYLLQLPSLKIEPYFIVDHLLDRAQGKTDEKGIEIFNKIVNSICDRKSHEKEMKTIKLQRIMSGTSPYARYRNSTLPIPSQCSPLNDYFPIASDIIMNAENEMEQWIRAYEEKWNSVIKENASTLNQIDNVNKNTRSKSIGHKQLEAARSTNPPIKQRQISSCKNMQRNIQKIADILQSFYPIQSCPIFEYQKYPMVQFPPTDDSDDYTPPQAFSDFDYYDDSEIYNLGF